MIAAVLTLLLLPAQARTSRALNVEADREEVIVSSGDTSGQAAVRIFDRATGQLLQRLHRPAWSSAAHRAIALDARGRLWVQDGSQGLFQFDRHGRFLRSFQLDLGPLCSPPDGDISDLAFLPDGRLQVLGLWDSGKLSYLLSIDPETEELLAFTDLISRSPPFGGSRMAVSAGGDLYLTERSTSFGLSSGRILVGAGLSVRGGPPGARELGSIAVMPGGALVVGDPDSGSLWRTGSSGLVWTNLASCGVSGARATFAVSHGFALVNDGCSGAGAGLVTPVRLRDGAAGAPLDVTAGGRFPASISHVLVRP